MILTAVVFIFCIAVVSYVYYKHHEAPQHLD